MATRYSLAHAYWMARAAGLAVQDPDGSEAQARTWGFEQVRCFESPHKMPFPIEDTQAYTMASDRMVVTGFRDTEVLKIYDWLTDVDIPPVPEPHPGRPPPQPVHPRPAVPGRVGRRQQAPLP
ncbi:hypothetical protein [Kitasatospora sp. NBC_01266]|uniref:hypothetical protein n=1 Tax=Kitasatospora sp. NBC_01266 TaxID=2903572 RepID=UPI002E3263BC|nr:hypothetical protein [Kitasatospora sp. NBC_01266]